MKKIRVVQMFRDINIPAVFHRPGEIVSVDDDRAARIIGMGLGEPVDEEPAKAVVKDEPEPDPVADSAAVPSEDKTADQAGETETPVKKTRKTRK